jgi:polar amino acid transport system permease protein
MLLKGVKITAILTVLGGALTLFVAFVVGLLRISENPIIRGITKVYVEIFRGTSLLVQLYWFYFVVPFFGIRLTAMQAGVLVLGLSYGAYAQEAVRSAILAVPEGQREAGIALNMKSSQIMRHVIIPQAIVRMVPPLGNRLIQLLKGTALVSMITLSELMYQGVKARMLTLQNAKVFGLVLIIYYLLAYPIRMGVNWTEKKVGNWRDA